nr:hypothetical protein [Saprospiraceae bacterium]HMQ84377.1 hypothetical protein [Saprospiraceae bacterium]
MLYFEGAYKIEVIVHSVVNVTGTSPDWPPMAVYAEVMVDRKYNFDCNETPGIKQLTLLNGGRQLLVTIDQPHNYDEEEYDLEWTFYDQESEVVQNLSTQSYDDYNVLFTNNATRVTFSGSGIEYVTNLLYPEGYLFFRVRAAQYDAEGNRQVTKWSTEGLSGTLNVFLDKKQIAWHENEMLNFQAQTLFAEGGKNVPSVTYFDGSLRARQSVTLSNAINKTIVSQSIYDHHGRPALQILPTPSESPFIQFDPLFAAASSGTSPYSKSNFDLGECSHIPEAMSSATGVARYYSPLNPHIETNLSGPINDLKYNYIPDAGGYPFAVTEFTPDLSGRIRRQGGVGAIFQPGNGKETQYFYGKPSQKELNRLFSNDVGEASHYFKNAVVDPNGQISVSYLDAHGRVVATALAGSAPTTLNALTPATAPFTNETDLLNNIASTFEQKSVYTLIVTDPGSYQFDYHIDPEFYQPPCLNGNENGPTACYDCLYTLRITVSDNCGGSDPAVYQASNFSSNQQSFDVTCPADTGGIDLDFTLSLAVGEYKIVKTLTLNEAAMQFFADHFMTQEVCLPDYDAILADIMADVDFSGCELDCDECVAQLGTLAAFTSALFGENPTPDEINTASQAYQEAIDECATLCPELPDECELLFSMMENDMTPGGQYARFAYENGEPEDQTSIFYLDRFKMLANGLVYRDENGDPDMVWHDGQWVVPTALDEATFIANWKPSWAAPLVETYHPEYCYYQWCTTNASSNDFDRRLRSVETWQEALAVSPTIVNSNGVILNYDPFFNGGNGASEQANMQQQLIHINPMDNMSPSLRDYIAEKVYGSSTIPFGSSMEEEDNNMAWKLLRNIYLGYKADAKFRILENLSDCDNSCIGNEESTCSDPCVNDGQTLCNTGANNLYAYKMPRYAYLKPPAPEDINTLMLEYEAEIVQLCEEICVSTANSWMQQIEDCVVLTPSEAAAIRDRLIAICQGACDPSHPFGASSLPGNLTTQYGDHSFEDVLDDVFSSPCNTPGCNPNMLNFPEDYDVTPYLGATSEFSLQNSCACNQLKNLLFCGFGVDSIPDSPVSLDAFWQYLQSLSDTPFEYDHFKTIIRRCGLVVGVNIGSNYLPEPIPIPPYLECNVCKTCNEVLPLITQYNAICSPSSPGYKLGLADYLNQHLGLNQTYEAYEDFYFNCQQSGASPAFCTFICPRSPFEVEPLENDCMASLISSAETQALMEYNRQLDELRNLFIESYLARCNPPANESFTSSYDCKLYHFTLYYYDQ